MQTGFSNTTLKPDKAEPKQTTDMLVRYKKDLQPHPLWVLEPKLFEAVLRIVSKHDVEQVITGANPRGWTEYAPEVETILPLLKRASCAADVEKFVRRVFRKCFRDLPRQTTAMAADLWKCIRRPDNKRALKNVVNLEAPIQNAVNQIRKLHPGNDDKLRSALIATLERQALQLKAETLFI